MTTTTLRTTTSTPNGPAPITLDVKATNLEMTVQAVPGLTEAIFELSGPEEVVDGTTARRAGERWEIDIPEPEPTVVQHSSGGVTFTNYGSGTTVVGGTQVFSGSGFVSMGGNTVINGNVITSGGEPVRATVRMPLCSSLRLLRLRNGAVHARGEYIDVSFSSTNASLSIQDAVVVEADTTNGNVTVGAATELIDVSTTNGSVDLNGTAPSTRARATNGSIFVSASCAGRIRARTTNGNVTVLRNGHDVDVDTSTTNGRDRVR